jgi:small membrane protein
MRPVQFILALMVLVIVVVYFSKFRSRAFDRVLVLFLAMLGLSMVIAPDWTNRAANLVGVGRGADLFIYLSIMSFSFVSLLFYSKMRDLEATITEMARAVAIKGAVPLRETEGEQSPPVDPDQAPKP